MCQLGDFEWWRMDSECVVTLEQISPPAWKLRVYPGAADVSAPTPVPGLADDEPVPEWLCAMTAETDPADPTGRTVHLSAVQGEIPADAPAKIKDKLRELGFTRMRWERRDRRTGKLRPFVFPL